MTIVLRDYQIDIIEKARNSIKNGCKRLLIQASTGSGKTAIAAYITNSSIQKAKSVLFICPRHEIMMQASTVMDNFNIEHGFIAARFTPKPYCIVQLAMIDSLRNRFEKLPIPSIVINDETHHAISPSHKKILDYYHLHGSIIIGLTATPQRLDGKPLGNMFDEIICGPNTYELIEAGYLSKYRYYAPPCIIDFDGIKKKFGDYDIQSQAERIDKPVIFGDAIAHYKRLLLGKRAIAFNVNVRTSKNFVMHCLSQDIPAAHIDGDTPISERSKSIQDFENGKIFILSNCSLFGEGFDMPSCQAVILLRKTASLALYLQMVGRALRPHNDKEHAMILDHVGCVNIHGLPDYPHEWSLDGANRRSSNKKNEDQIKIKQCTYCYHVFTPQPCCPNCGREVGLSPREIEQIEGELLEINQNQIKIEKKKEVGMARSLQDLEQIARDRGYKHGWAKHIWEARAKRK